MRLLLVAYFFPPCRDTGAHRPESMAHHLAEAVSTFIHTVSVAHSADHFAYSQQPMNVAPLRLRVPPPASKRMEPLDRSRLLWRRDAFRHWMARRMYFDTGTLKSWSISATTR